MDFLSVLRCLCLFGGALLNMDKDKSVGASFWPIFGQGVRGLVALGLHRDPENWNLAVDEAEGRRKLFWQVSTGCHHKIAHVYLTTFLSTGLGLWL